MAQTQQTLAACVKKTAGTQRRTKCRELGPLGPGFARSRCADSQSVEVGSLHNNGFDGAKSVNGKKRHLLVDTLGLVLGVLVTSANVPERKGLSLRLNHSRPHLPRLHHLWLDRGYKGVAFTNRVLLCFGVVLEIVARRAEKGFGLQARRWVVERTFAWLGNYRRLSKDYETLPASSEAFIYLASCDLITKRLAHTNCIPWRNRGTYSKTPASTSTR